MHNTRKLKIKPVLLTGEVSDYVSNFGTLHVPGRAQDTTTASRVWGHIMKRKSLFKTLQHYPTQSYVGGTH